MYENKVTFHNAANATATGTVMTTTAISLVSVQITGTFVATVTFKGSIDGENYVALEAINRSTGAKATTATAAGLYSIPVVGCRKFICDLTWTSGTSITVTGIGQENGNTLLPDITLAGDVNIDDASVDIDADTIEALNYPVGAFYANGTYTSAQTNTSLKAATASNSHYITDILVTNDGTAAITVALLDGSGGTSLIGTQKVAAFGGFNMNLSTPIKLTANTALCLTTTGTSNFAVAVVGYTT